MSRRGTSNTSRQRVRAKRRARTEQLKAEGKPTSKEEYEAWLDAMTPAEQAAHVRKQAEKKSRHEAERKAAQGKPRRRRGRGGQKNAMAWEKAERVVKPCPACGITALMTKDHIIPLSKGGPNVRSNIQWLCKDCNNEKGNSLTWTPPLKRAAWKLAGQQAFPQQPSAANMVYETPADLMAYEELENQ